MTTISPTPGSQHWVIAPKPEKTAQTIIETALKKWTSNPSNEAIVYSYSCEDSAADKSKITTAVQNLLKKLEQERGDEIFKSRIMEDEKEENLEVYLWSPKRIEQPAPGYWATCCFTLRMLTTECLTKRIPMGDILLRIAGGRRIQK
jgi:hypothetical protein